MEDQQGSWKGHSFTLIVFIGIVVLCSIFFVLGMVVGRGQVQHAADAATAGPAGKPAVQAEKTPPETDKDTPIVVDRAPAAPPKEESVPPKAEEAPPVKTAAKPKPVDPPAPAAAPAPKPSADKMTYLQVAALEQSGAANKQVDDLRKKGFHALALIQPGDDGKKLYHVQVGPFSNAADVDIAKRKLEALGYKPIKK